MNKEMLYRVAVSEADFQQGKELFKEYVTALGVDLSFQDFDRELQLIQVQYGAPGGALLLALDGTVAVGCSGIRTFEDGIAELKRMYVKSEYREAQIGMHLLAHSIRIAKELGFRKIRLDTLKDMTKAQALYRSSGFYEIPPYRHNPIAGTIYMEKEL